MGAGLQVFGENGEAIATESDRLGKFLGTFDTLGTNGSITDVRLEGMRLWVAITRGIWHTGSSDYDYAIPKIIRSGNTISWIYPNLRRIRVCQEFCVNHFSAGRLQV